MKNEEPEIRELAWRLPSDPAARAAWAERLAQDPEWAEEGKLTELLQQLPPVQVSSNFTARVLQAVRSAEPAEKQRRLQPEWFWPAWRLVPASLGLVVLVGALTAALHFRQEKRAEIARNAARLSNMAAMPKLEWLADFEAINRLGQPPVDEELLNALTTLK